MSGILLRRNEIPDKVRDGSAALNFLFCQGACAGRTIE
jgi:hypothetical protein